MIGKFFHTPRPKRFEITTRYYDPEKEEMKDREARIKHELGIDDEKVIDENYRANLRGQFRRGMGDFSKTADDARRRMTTRLVILFVILAFALFLLMKF